MIPFVSALLAHPLQAQFMWQRLDRQADQAQATLYFGRFGVSPGYDILPGVAAAKVTRRTIDAPPAEIALVPFQGDDDLVLTKSWPVTSDRSMCLEASSSQVVHGQMRHDYAKAIYFAGDGNDSDSTLRFAKQHRLDIVPSFDNGKLIIEVDWDGRPRSNVRVHVTYPDLRPARWTTGTSHRFVIKAKPGLYTFRTSRYEPSANNAAGEEPDRGSAYFATLTFFVTEQMVAGSSD